MCWHAARAWRLPNRTSPSVEREYAAALLFALADPGRLPRPSLAAAHAFIAGLAPRARIEAATTAEAGDNTSCRFLLIADKGRPAQPLANVEEDKAQAPHGLVLDCSAVIPEIERLIAAGAEAAPLPLEIMRLLHDAWSAAATAPRRFSRTQFKPRIDMITGLPAILRLLSGRTLGRRQSDDAHGDEQDASEWLVINESPDGFGIQHLSGEAPALDIGDLVLLRPREHGKIHICLVRRSNHAGREHLELGVQLLSSKATPLPLPSEDILAMGQQGLLLPRLPAFGNAAGLITAAGALTSQSVITDNQEGTLKYYRLGSRIATSTAIEFHLLQSSLTDMSTCDDHCPAPGAASGIGIPRRGPFDAAAFERAVTDLLRACGIAPDARAHRQAPHNACASCGRSACSAATTSTRPRRSARASPTTAPTWW